MAKKRIRKKAPGLSGRVERLEIPPQAVDRADPDLLSYVSAFVESFSKMPRLEPFSLATQAEARAALKMLDARRTDLESRLKTARSLKELLENARGFKGH